MMRSPMKFADMEFTGHHLVGFVWPAKSSRTGEEYNVVLTERGFECNCIGAQMHGKCKHIKHVHDILVED